MKKRPFSSRWEAALHPAGQRRNSVNVSVLQIQFRVDYFRFPLEEMRMQLDLFIEPPLRPIPAESLAGRVALVTGASRGIGAVTARVLARAGAHVILNYRSKGLRAEKVAGEIESAGGIEGTITPRLLNRTNRGLIDFRRRQAARLPTVEEFGLAIAQATADPHLKSGTTVYVGATD